MCSDNRNGCRAASARGFTALCAALVTGLGLVASPAEAAPFAYVTNRGIFFGTGSVSVIDTATNMVVAAVTVGTSSTRVVGATGVPHATTYTLKELGPLPSGISSIALGINNSGQVVGVSYTASTGSAVLWNGTTPTALGTLPGGTGGLAQGINNSAQVVGASDSASTNTQATIWNGTTPTALLPVGNFGEAVGINNSRQMAGYTAYGGNFHALFWNNPSATPTILNEKPWSIAYAINDLGQVGGASGGSGADAQATIWMGTAPTILGMLPGGSVSVGYAINNSGQVAGYTGAGAQATIWNGTTPTALGTLPGWEESLALGINDLGQVVGYSRSNGLTKATIWHDTTPIDLSTLLDGTGAGWTLSQATAINSVGQIAGWGFNGLGQERAFLLTPGTPFLAFAAVLNIDFGTAPNTDAFKLGTSFTLGSTAPAINPVTQVVTLQIGTYSVTIPAGSFNETGKGIFSFEGVINGVTMKVVIKSTGTLRYSFQAGAQHASLTGTQNAVYVTLAIGGGSGATSVTATISGAAAVKAAMSR